MDMQAVMVPAHIHGYASSRGAPVVMQACLARLNFSLKQLLGWRSAVLLKTFLVRVRLIVPTVLDLLGAQQSHTIAYD